MCILAGVAGTDRFPAPFLLVRQGKTHSQKYSSETLGLQEVVLADLALVGKVTLKPELNRTGAHDQHKGMN